MGKLFENADETQTRKQQSDGFYGCNFLTLRQQLCAPIARTVHAELCREETETSANTTKMGR